MHNLFWLKIDIEVIESFKTSSYTLHIFLQLLFQKPYGKEGILVTVLDLVNPFCFLLEMVQIQMVVVPKVI